MVGTPAPKPTAIATVRLVELCVCVLEVFAELVVADCVELVADRTECGCSDVNDVANVVDVGSEKWMRKPIRLCSVRGTQGHSKCCPKAKKCIEAQFAETPIYVSRVDKAILICIPKFAMSSECATAMVRTAILLSDSIFLAWGIDLLGRLRLRKV